MYGLKELNKKKREQFLRYSPSIEWVRQMDFCNKNGQIIWAGASSTSSTSISSSNTTPALTSGTFAAAKPSTVNMNLINSSGIGSGTQGYYLSMPGYTNHMVRDITDVPFNNVFATPSIKLYRDPNFKMQYMTLSNISWGTTTQAFLADESIPGIITTLHAAAKVLVISSPYGSTTYSFNVFSSSVLTSSISVVIPDSSVFTIISDGAFYWVGVSPTVNDPEFTYTKICEITSLPLTSLNFHIGAYKTMSTLQSTGTIGCTITAFTGSLPW